jgi:Fe/S biogenesis protein NfuA
MSTVLAEAPAIQITESGQAHFGSLIEKEAMSGMALRIFVDQPGFPTADISISFCPPGENRAGDMPVEFDGFTLFVDKASAQYLQNAVIDYKKGNLGGELAITAPHLRPAKPTTDSNLVDRINYILETEVNPNLASHGGMVSLVEITPHNEAILRFGGGCHGCGMVDVTLKQGIEKAILAQIPEITAVKDVTDHSSGENPYYK